MENEFKQSRSVLKYTEDEVDSLLFRMGKMEEHLLSIRCALQQRKEEVEPLTWRMGQMEDNARISKMEHSHHQHARMGQMEEKARWALTQKEEEVKSLSDRMRQMEDNARWALKQKEEEVKSLSLRMGQMEEKARSDLTQKEEEVKSLSLRVKAMEDSDQQQTQSLRSDLELKEEEVKSLSFRMRQMENNARRALKQKEEEVKSLSFRMGQMEENARSHLKLKEDQVVSLKQRMGQMEDNARWALKQREEEMKSLSFRMGQMEDDARSALEEKDKELRSFKDRVAGDVALSMKTGKRLKEMYEELWSQWPKIKNDLMSKKSPESVTKLIQEKFNEAILDMEKKKQQIVEVFVLDDLSRGSASEKVQQYQQSTCQNLQLALYHGRKEDADLKPPSTGYEGGKPQDVKEYWASKCYWLGCLMALNNPPLQPDWKNHDPQMDPWDFFPRNLTAASGK